MSDWKPSDGEWANEWGTPRVAADADATSRGAFIARTYAHLAGAILALVALEVFLFASGIAATIASVTLGGGRLGWLVVLGAFMAVGWIADRWARSDTSQATQYLGLGAYVLAEAVILVPLLYVAAFTAGEPGVIGKAAVITLALFGGLTGIVFVTRKDFSFLRSLLMFGGFAAMALIVVALLMGLTLGTFFAWALLALAGGYVLYDTSNVLHHYRTDQHVAASLALFAAIALMFWYVLQILSSRR